MKNLTAVVFDLAGTVVDHGSRAPVATLESVFAAAGMPITVDEAREDMGIAKRDHIAAILSRKLGHPAPEEQVDRLYADFIPKQFSCLLEYSDVIEGVPALMEELREKGLKIGATTGYTRPMLEELLAHAAKQGFIPDVALCPEDVPGGGRPAPWMCYLMAVKLQTTPFWSMVKIGDTPADMQEGVNAGMWTIGITRTGNEVGMTAEEWYEAASGVREEAIERASNRLADAGAHYLAESVEECLEILQEISDRLADGERP